MREVVAVPTGMSVVEREHYVRWWIEKSGLTLFQLGQLATAIWGDGAIRPARRQSFERLSGMNAGY